MNSTTSRSRDNIMINEEQFLLHQVPPSDAVAQPDKETSKTCQWSGLRRYNWKNVVVGLCLWLAYTFCNVAYSTINPFFPGIVRLIYIMTCCNNYDNYRPMPKEHPMLLQEPSLPAPPCVWSCYLLYWAI